MRRFTKRIDRVEPGHVIDGLGEVTDSHVNWTDSQQWVLKFGVGGLMLRAPKDLTLDVQVPEQVDEYTFTVRYRSPRRLEPDRSRQFATNLRSLLGRSSTAGSWTVDDTIVRGVATEEG